MNVIPMLTVIAAACIMVSFIVVLVAGIVGGGYLTVCRLVQGLRGACPAVVGSSPADTGQSLAARHI
jgi:hypothetical protein